MRDTTCRMSSIGSLTQGHKEWRGWPLALPSPLASDSEIERTATAAACDVFRWTTTVGGKEAEDKAAAI